MKGAIGTVMSILLLTSYSLPAQGHLQQQLEFSEMLIGDQQHVTLVADQQGSQKDLFTIMDTLSWMQILDKGSWIIISDNQFERKIRFTVFDSGYYQIPALLEGSNPLFLVVNNPPDSLQELRPIKDIETTSIPINYLKWIIIGGTLILLMLIILYILFKADKAGNVTYIPETIIPAWEKAMKALKEVEVNYLYNEENKNYYDTINFILRQFLSQGCYVPSLEKNSKQIIQFIQENRPEMVQVDFLQASFETTDLVKFANLKTKESVNQKWLDVAKTFVEQNKNYSIRLSEENKMNWISLLGNEMALQFEYPEERVPEILVELCEADGKTLTFSLMVGIASVQEFTLPQKMVQYNNGLLGHFTKWHLSLAYLSSIKLIKYLSIIFLLSAAAVLLPVIYLVSLWKKENLFSRGIFLVSKNKRLLLNHKKL